MSDYQPKKGDRVRLTIEGEVTDHNGTYFIVRQNGLWAAEFHQRGDFAIEKIEPPVVQLQFRPGDTVRNKRQPSLIYSLGNDGYFAHEAKEWRFETTRGFTSADFEKVNLD